jgi:hypothetical protein
LRIGPPLEAAANVNDTDNIADAGRADPDLEVELDDGAEDDGDSGVPELAEGAAAGLLEPAPARAESSLLQAARASSAAPNAPLRAVRRDTTAKREYSECVMVHV